MHARPGITDALVGTPIAINRDWEPYNALRVSEPADWGLDGKRDKTKAYIQCPDVCEYTGGGTVVFEIGKVSEPPLNLA